MDGARQLVGFLALGPALDRRGAGSGDASAKEVGTSRKARCQPTTSGATQQQASRSPCVAREVSLGVRSGRALKTKQAPIRVTSARHTPPRRRGALFAKGKSHTLSRWCLFFSPSCRARGCCGTARPKCAVSRAPWRPMRALTWFVGLARRVRRERAEQGLCAAVRAGVLARWRCRRRARRGRRAAGALAAHRCLTARNGAWARHAAPGRRGCGAARGRALQACGHARAPVRSCVRMRCRLATPRGGGGLQGRYRAPAPRRPPARL